VARDGGIEMGARTLRIAVVAAIVGGIGWLAKMAIMAAQGGPDTESATEAIAFFAGLIGVLVAAVAVALYASRARPRHWRIAAGVGGFLAVALAVGLGQAALTALPGDGWWQEEAPLGVIGLVALVWGLATLRSTAWADAGTGRGLSGTRTPPAQPA
jgi:hypothetical protein